MAAIILYQHDHQARAVALSQAIGARAVGVDTQPQAGGIDTLIFWGHGDPYALCGKTATQIQEIVKRWKAKNNGLNTVEILTCNARHAPGNTSPIASQIKRKLHGAFSSTRNIKVKALPVSVGGKHNAWSILLADTTSRSWVYVTAPGTNDANMMAAQALIRFDQGPGGGMVSYTGDIAVKANKVVADRAHINREWSMVYGYFNTLRSALVKV